MRSLMLVVLLVLLLPAGDVRAQQTAGPWQVCDFSTIDVTVDSDALLPGIAAGRRLTARCFAHAIRGSNLTAGQVRLGSLSPQIARGDLVAFRRPEDTTQTAIRRVIGLPGDRVQLRDYRVLINGSVLPTAMLGETTIADAQGRQIPALRLHETMTRFLRAYDILVPPDTTDGSGTSQPFTVPMRSVYVLADNRATPANVRAPVSGLVPVVNLIALVMVAPGK